MPDPTDKTSKKSWFQRVFGSKAKGQPKVQPTTRTTEPEQPLSEQDIAKAQYTKAFLAFEPEMKTLLARDKDLASRSVRVAQEALNHQLKQAKALETQGEYQTLLDKHLKPMLEALEALRDAAKVHDEEKQTFVRYYSAYHHQVRELLSYPINRAPQWLKDAQTDVKRLETELKACTEPSKAEAEEAYNYEEALKRAKALATVLTPAIDRKRKHEQAMRRYYSELSTIKSQVAYADALGDDPAWATELALVQTLKGEVVQAQNDADFTEALQKLASLREALKALVAKRLEGLKAEIDDADTADKVKDVVTKLKGEEISSLPATEQVKLLRTLRESGGDIDEDTTPELYKARCKIYDNMKMDPEFVTKDELNRNEVIQRLRNDPKVEDAKKKWASWDTHKRIDFLQYVAKQQCKVMGQPEPKLKPFSQPRSSSGSLLFGSCDLGLLAGKKTSTITINTHPDANFDNIEEQMNTMLHENAHNYQLDLVCRYRQDTGGLSKLTPDERKLLPQIIMWDENANGYVPDGDTYNKQPLEAHAWGFGNEGAAGVMGPVNVAKLEEGVLPDNAPSDLA